MRNQGARSLSVVRAGRQGDADIAVEPGQGPPVQAERGDHASGRRRRRAPHRGRRRGQDRPAVGRRRRDCDGAERSETLVLPRAEFTELLDTVPRLRDACWPGWRRTCPAVSRPVSPASRIRLNRGSPQPSEPADASAADIAVARARRSATFAKIEASPRSVATASAAARASSSSGLGESASMSASTSLIRA
jgi:hypothetical protein